MKARLLLATVLVTVFCATFSAAQKYTASDVALHLQHCNKRPVTFVWFLAAKLATDRLPPCDEKALAEWLAPRQMSAVWEPTILLLTTKERNTWNHLRLETTVRSPSQNELRQESDSADDLPDDYEYIPVRRALSQEELKQVREWILQDMPLPPTMPPWACVGCLTAVVELDVVLDAVRLSQGGRELIIGSISFLRDTSQIVAIENDHGVFHLEWMSPLLNPYSQVVYYRDVNGDGTAEIWSVSHKWAGRRLLYHLSILDEYGHELTREVGDCDEGVTAEHGRAPAIRSACPIMDAEPFLGHYLEDGKVVLTTDLGDGENGGTYKFVGGKYALIKPKPRKTHR